MGPWIDIFQWKKEKDLDDFWYIQKIDGVIVVFSVMVVAIVVFLMVVVVSVKKILDRHK